MTVGPNRTHGTTSTYRHGCRCVPCTAANTAYRRKQRTRPAESWAHFPITAVSLSPVNTPDTLTRAEYYQARGA